MIAVRSQTGCCARIINNAQVDKRLNFIFIAGRTAFIGVGFADRSNAFDLNVTLQDHFKRLKVEQDIEKEKDAPKPALDLGFKEGEKISIPTKCFKKRDQVSLLTIYHGL